MFSLFVFETPFSDFASTVSFSFDPLATEQFSVLRVEAHSPLRGYLAGPAKACDHAHRTPPVRRLERVSYSRQDSFRSRNQGWASRSSLNLNLPAHQAWRQKALTVWSCRSAPI